MRNLKKILSGLLVAAIMLTTMVPAFAATSYTYETQAKALYDLGLFKGVSTGEYNPDLGSAMDRQAGVVMMLRLVGKIDAANAISDSEANAALANYTDANTIEDWAKKPIAYAVENSLVIGTTQTTVGPTEQFIGKMFAAIILRNVGYQITDANYDASTSTMVEKGGLTAAEAIKFNDKNLIRDDMVGMSYGSLKLQNATTAKTIIETLVADGKVNKALAISLGLIKEVVQGATAVQTGAKTFTVSFNAPVDPAKVAVVVKKGAITLNTATVTPAADNKSLAIEMATLLSTDDYTISIAGVTTEALTATVSAQEQKISKIEFTSDKVVLDRTDAKIVTTGYKVSNQFGEDVTKTADVQFTSGVGTATGSSDGVLTITGTTDFDKDDKMAISAINVATNTFASGIFTVVDKAQVAAVSIASLYNVDNKILDINSIYSNFWLVVDAKDQYGNKIPTNAIGEDVIISSSNTSVASVSTFSNESIDGTTHSVLKLVAPATPLAGTAKITIISKTTGAIASYDVVVKDQVKADKISFSAPEFAVAGEKVTVPFTAIDQFGNEITNANNALTSLTPSFSDKDVSGAFSQDYVKGVPTLTVDGSLLTEAKSVVMTVVTTTGKLGQLTINFAAPAKAAVVSGLVDVSNKLLLGNTVSINAEDNVVIRDQYNRVMDLNTANNTVSLTSSDVTKVAVVGDVYKIDATNTTISLNAAKKGFATVTMNLQDAAGKDVAGSEFQTTFTVVEKADIVSYEVADVAKVYYGGADYAKELKVYGVLADGSKVAIPYMTNGVENFKVVFSATGVTFGSDAKFAADNTVAFDTDMKTKDVSVVVTVVGATGTQVFSKTVTASKESIKADTLTIDTKVTNTVESDGLVSANIADANTQAGLEAVVKSILTVKDQYGIKIATPSITVVATNLPDGKVLGAIDGASALVKGESYNVTVVTNNAKVLNFVMKLK